MKKFIVKNWALIGLVILIITLIFVAKNCARDREDPEELKAQISELKGSLKEKENVITGQRETIEEGISDKEDLRKKFDEYKAKDPKILIREKKVVIKDVEYITVKDCEKIVYDFSDPIKDMYSEYIHKDLSFEQNIHRLFGSLDEEKFERKKLGILNEKNTRILEKKIKKLKKKLRRERVIKWVAVILAGGYIAYREAKRDK